MSEDDDTDLHQKVMQQTLGELNSGADACVICLERISEQAIALPCTHANFDFLCLASWLQQRPTCPLCNALTRKVQYDLNASTLKILDVRCLKNGGQHNTEQQPSGSPSFIPRRRMPPRARQIVECEALTPDAALLRRQNVYRHGLYSLHVGSNRLSRFQQLTARDFAQDPELLSRARKWIRRELQVFEFLNVDSTHRSPRGANINNAEFLLEYIIAILKTVDLKASGGQAEELLRDFLGRENTRLFLHELQAWLRSPYMALDDWDRAVQYDEEDNTTGLRSSRSPQYPFRRRSEGGKVSKFLPPTRRMQPSARQLRTALDRYRPD